MSGKVLIKYFGTTLPELCGYSGEHLSAIGRLVEMGYETELADASFLPSDKMTIEERASFLLPYAPKVGYEKAYNKGLLVAAACVASHRYEEHGDLSAAEFDAYIEELDSEELEIVDAASAWDA